MSSESFSNAVDEEDGLMEDYYGFLNLPKDCSVTDIDQAFRRLSRVYHPDRHMDPVKKQDAEKFFRRLQRAHDVLADPHKRAVYDTVGVQGLKVGGWELLPQLFSASQVRDEYERLKRQAEQEQLISRCNPTGGMAVRIDATDLFSPVTEEEEQDGFLHRDWPYLEVTSISMQQSIEAPLTAVDRLIAGGQVATTNGSGSGSLSCIWRRVISSKLWSELNVEMGEVPSVGLKLTRTISSRMYCTMQPMCNVHLGAIHWTDMFEPGINIGVTRQLDVHVMGTVNAKLGLQQNLTTSLVYDDHRTKNITAALAIGLPSSYVVLSYTHRFTHTDSWLRCTFRLGNFGLLSDASCETRLNSLTKVGATARLLLPAANLSLKLKVTRTSHSYSCDFVLCDAADYLPTTLVLGIGLPAASLLLLRALVGDAVSSWLDDDKAEHNRRLRDTMEQRKQDAARMVDLMRDTAQRVADAERKRNGLVIVEATFGELFTSSNLFTQHYQMSERVVDVAVPLQTLVSDSKLLLTDANKCALPGFYDPCPGVDKVLVVKYLFHDREHRVAVGEHDPLLLPKQSHQIS